MRGQLTWMPVLHYSLSSRFNINNRGLCCAASIYFLSFPFPSQVIIVSFYRFCFHCWKFSNWLHNYCSYIILYPYIWLRDVCTETSFPGIVEMWKCASGKYTCNWNVHRIPALSNEVVLVYCWTCSHGSVQYRDCNAGKYYTGTSKQRTLWEHSFCPLFGGCPLVGGSNQYAT